MSKSQNVQPSNKRAKHSDSKDFVKDGMETLDIRNIVQDIMLYMEDNKGKHSHIDILNNYKLINGNVAFFEERYPLLYEMVTKEGGFDYSNFEYFLKMREDIVQEKITSEGASKVIGEKWFDKYCKNKI